MGSPWEKVLEEVYRDGMIVRMTSGFGTPENLSVYGSEDGTFTYRVIAPDGCLRSEGSYERGIMSGEIRVYYNNGNLKQKFSLKNGEYDGEAVTCSPQRRNKSSKPVQ
ncbi:MAG: hypothetical protein R2758_15945 [Bacteroidales bacterium]